MRRYPFFTIGLTVVLAFVLPDALAARLDRAALRGATPLNKPALFERNDGQFAADIAFRANFAQLDAAIHTNGSFTILPKPGMSAGASPVRFALSGANSRHTARAEHEQSYRTNYFQGGERPINIHDVPHFARVQFDEVYPRVGLAYYPANGKLEYDFIVLPGGDTNQISWKVSGAQSVKVSTDGDLVVHAASGEYVQRKPHAYQTIEGEKRPVDAAFRVASDGTVGFALGKYDKSATLVIDPVIEYASYLGGSGDDSPRAVTIGPDGFIYVTGFTNSSDFPTASAYSARLGGVSDAFVSKINPTTGALVYSTYLGDSRNADNGMGIAVDSAGSAYITGLAGAKFPTTVGSYVASSTAKSGFLTKLSPAGNALTYSTLIPGTQPRAIAIDAQGRAAIAGTAGSSFRATTGAFQTVFSGDNTFSSADLTNTGDAFALMLNSTGSAPVFATYCGAEAYDDAAGIAIDTAGNIWVGGASESSGLLMQGAFQPASGGGRDAFITAFTSSGQLIASSYLGGSQREYAVTGLAADPYGNVVMAGETESDNFPTVNALQSRGSIATIYTSTRKGYIAKFALSPLRIVFSTFLGSNANNGDTLSGVTVDRAGDIHVVGQMNAEVITRFSLQSAFMGGATILSRYTNGRAVFAMGIGRNGHTRHYATLLAPCKEANFCTDRAIGSRLAGEVVVAGSTFADWVPIAAANTKPKIAGKLPIPQDGFLMTLDLHRADLVLTSSSSATTSNCSVALQAIS